VLIHTAVISVVWIAAHSIRTISLDRPNGTIAPIEVALEEAPPETPPLPARLETPPPAPVALPQSPAPSEFAAAPAIEQAPPQPERVVDPSPPAAAPVTQGAPAPANPKARDSYIATLMAWLNRYKKYPTQARRDRVQGVAVVRFTINPDGAVVSSAIARSSGHAVLDEAALDVFTRANPVPAIPESISRGPLTLTVPIEFSLITE
jgi:protein TonB